MREGDIFEWRNVVVSRVSEVSTTIKMDARIKSAHSALPTWDCRVWWPEHASLSLNEGLRQATQLPDRPIWAAEIIPEPN